MSLPTVTVVIPTLNRRAWVLEAVEAVCSQHYGAGIDIVVLDDGSVDGTAEALRRRKWSRPVRIIETTERGPAAARNLGVVHATGDVVAFIDDDCVPQPGWIEHLAPAATAGGAGGTTLMLSDGSLVADFIASLWQEAAAPGEDASPQILSCNSAFRRDLLGDGFDEHFRRPGCEDTELAARLGRRGVSLSIVEAAVVHHRPRSSFAGLVIAAFYYGRGWRRYREKDGRPLRPAQLVKMIAALPFFLCLAHRHRGRGAVRAIAYAFLNRLRLAAAAAGALSGRWIYAGRGRSTEAGASA
ncbi:MAG: glycosyltransferase [Acidobacteriota bacterium]